MRFDSLRAQIHSRVSLPMVLLVVVGIAVLAGLVGHSLRQIELASTNAATRLAISAAAADLALDLERAVLHVRTVDGNGGRAPEVVVEAEIAKLQSGVARLAELERAGAFARDIGQLGEAVDAIRAAARDAVIARWALTDLAAVMPAAIADIRADVRNLLRALAGRGDLEVAEQAANLRDAVDRVASQVLDLFASGELDTFEPVRAAVTALGVRADTLRERLGAPTAEEARALRDFERVRSRLYRYVTEQGGATERSRHAAGALLAIVDEFGGTTHAMRVLAGNASALSVADIDSRSERLNLWLIAAGFVGLGCLALVLLWLDRRVIGPLDALNESMKRLAAGDTAITIAGVARRDEIGDMARSLAVFRDNATEQEAQQRRAALAAQDQVRRRQALDAAVADFRHRVSSIVAEVREGGTRTQSVAAALGGAVSASRQHIGESRGAAKESADNMAMVAAAADELATSIRLIAEQSQRASEITRSARGVGRHSTAKVNDLVAASSRIDDIIRLIRTIAGQINLLSLNAAIEAARAGDAGRGFAVVASEVKALAQATDNATMEITAQVTLIQQATREAADTMRTIESVLDDVGQFSETVAQSVEQQGQATLMIASSTARVAARAELMTTGFRAVEDTIEHAHGAAVDFARHSADLTSSAGTLADAVDRFLDVAAA